MDLRRALCWAFNVDNCTLGMQCRESWVHTLTYQSMVSYHHNNPHDPESAMDAVWCTSNHPGLDLEVDAVKDEIKLSHVQKFPIGYPSPFKKGSPSIFDDFLSSRYRPCSRWHFTEMRNYDTRRVGHRLRHRHFQFSGKLREMSDRTNATIRHILAQWGRII